MEDRIKVIDGYPGIGKSSWAIQKINESDGNKILYVTPLLTEAERIQNSCRKRDFVQPDEELGFGTKMNHLVYLVKLGRNIVMTCPPKSDPSRMLQIRQKEAENAKEATIFH